MNSRFARTFCCHLALAFVVLVSPNIAFAQTHAETDKDLREITAYKLTDDDFTKMRQAQKAMEDLEKKNPALKKKDNEESDNGQKSIDQSVQQIEAHPELKSALKSAGLTPRHFVVITYALFANAVAIASKKAGAKQLPPGASAANIDFLEKHQKELEELQKDSAPQNN